MHTDDELVLLLKQAQASAFEEIYNRYWDKLYNYAFKRLHLSEICEEITQDVFTRLWQKRADISISVGLSNYLYSSIKYNLVDYYRRQVLQQNYVQSSKLVSQSGNTTEDYVFLNDLQNQINQIVEHLPQKCRNVYQLSRFEQKNNKEIAVLLNISEKTVEGHLTKALQQLRLNLAHFLSIFFF
jgi:RNA polymerase sigma-70 factor (ECF subfamily)